MSKRREEDAPVLTRAGRFMAARLAASRKAEEEYEATLDPRERPQGQDYAGVCTPPLSRHSA